MTITSNYEIDLSIQDNTKDAIRQIQDSLGGLGKAFEPEKTEKQIKAVIERLRSLAQNTELDIGAVGKIFNKGTQNLLGELELRGVEQREQLEEAKAKYEELEKQINDIWKTKPFLVEEADIEELRRKQKDLNIEQLENDIAHNKQLRLILKTRPKNRCYYHLHFRDEEFEFQRD